MRYLRTDDFYHSHKMSEAKASEARLLKLLGDGNDECGDGKSDMHWEGILALDSGECVKVAAWDWKGGMRQGYGVSIWCDKPEHLHTWKRFLESHPLT